MGFKTIVYFVLLLAALVLITSEATARELAETSTSKLENTEAGEQQTMGVEEAKYPGRYGGDPGYTGGYGGWGYGRPGCYRHCHGRCCTYEEVMMMEKDRFFRINGIPMPRPPCDNTCRVGGRIVCCSYEEAMMEKGN